MGNFSGAGTFSFFGYIYPNRNYGGIIVFGFTGQLNLIYVNNGVFYDKNFMSEQSSSPQKYIGAPLGAYTYGILVTFDMESYSPTFASLQIYFPDKANVNGIYVRAVMNQEWAKFVGTSINSVAASQ